MSPLESSDSSSTVASIKKFSRSVSIPQPVLSMVSGAGAGILCTLICAPLDVAKVRMQVQGGLGMNKYHGVFSSVSYIYTEEGLRGLFRGVGPAMITIPLFWGCYWPIYDSMKTFLAENHSKESISMQHLISAVCAGAVGDIITNPFWVTRTRFQTLALHKELAGIDPNISTFQMMRRIYEEEGIHAFYRGLGASFLGLSHVAIQFPLYEYLKTKARDANAGEDSFLGYVAASVAAKLIASTTTYPHEVLRVRLQDARFLKEEHKQHKQQVKAVLSSRGSVVEMISVYQPRLLRLLAHIVRSEGVTALWSGLRVNLLRIIPSTITTFLSYEYISRYLKTLTK